MSKKIFMKETVLYIDDEQANLDAFRMVFGDMYHIILCQNAKQVYEAIQSTKIKVLISDQRMPNITGLDLCERISKIDPDIVCVILTAFVDIGVTLQAINQGNIHRFMLKPWDKEEMRGALANAIDKYNLKEENKELIKNIEQKNIDLEKEKRKAEETEKNLRAQKSLTDAILQYSQMGFALNEIESGKVIYINDAFHKAYRLPQDFGSNVTEFFNYVYANNQEQGQKILDDIQSGDPNKFVWLNVPLKDKNGMTFYVSAWNIPLFEQNIMISSVLDVTTQRTSELNLIHNEARQSAMISNISDIIGIVNQEGEIVYKSPNLSAHYGWLPEELVGLNAMVNVHPDDLRITQNEFNNIFKTDNAKTTLEFRYKCKDGSYKPTHLTAVNLINHPQIQGVLLNYHDISMQKEAEMEILAVNEELQVTTDVLMENEVRLELQNQELYQAKEEAEENERKLNTLIKNLAGVVYRCKNDEDWTMEFLSEYASGLTGYPSQDFIENNKRSWSDIIHPDFRAYVWETVQEALKNRIPFHLSYKIRSAHGLEKWVSEHGQGIYHKDDLVAIEGIIYDTTSQKQVEHELILAKEKAEESDRLKSAFLANMSHEIRTPMNGILGFSQLLNTQELSKEKQNEFTIIIEKLGQQLLSIVNNVLDISKIETNQIHLVEEDVCLNMIFNDLYSNFSLHAKSNGVLLTSHLSLDDEASQMMLDKTKIYQILNNLIGNALKFTDEGEVHFGYELKDGSLVLFVEDTGVGIQKNLHDKIFDRFFQGDSSATRVYGGNGLGLAICKSFIELMQGEIKILSEPNKGTRFEVSLPLKKLKAGDHPTNLELVSSETTLAEDHEALLIVEDEMANYMYLREVAQDYFKHILHARNGKEAVELCKENQGLSLILMDIKMPVLDGLEATKQIRAINPDVKIVMQSAHVFEEDKKKGFDAGCDDFISKPIDMYDIINIFKKYKK